MQREEAGPAGSGRAVVMNEAGEVEVRALGAGLLVEEHREEIAAAWKRAVAAEPGGAEPALAFAVAPLLREMALGLRQESRSGEGEGWTRCAVLVRSTAAPARLAREFRMLRRAVWDVLRVGRQPISPEERRAVDEWLDEALERSLERLERMRLRVEAFERTTATSAPKPAPVELRRTPPPLPSRRPAPGAAGAVSAPGAAGAAGPVR